VDGGERLGIHDIKKSAQKCERKKQNDAGSAAIHVFAKYLFSTNYAKDTVGNPNSEIRITKFDSACSAPQWSILLF
jgi:hypothetical protein